ncbi:MAG: DUF2284 domain-containing protein [Dehalococcoidales bacterium]|nr:DUF2284 domain-containing protein [Dehalococcoidales bacterium]
MPASSVLVEERVRMKCFVPRCRSLGSTPYCPPNTPELDFIRKVFSQYRWAIVFKRDITSLEDYIPTSEAQRREGRTQPGPREGFHDKTHDIVDRLESYVQSEGYDLALGFSAGTCKGNLCRGAPCAVFQNGGCRFPLRARPSMEAVGIDVFGLANKVGWDIYMIRSIEPDLNLIPCGTSIGIVFVY